MSVSLFYFVIVSWRVGVNGEYRHEPVLPGGTEIAAATGRPDANARIAVVVAGALVVDALFR